MPSKKACSERSHAELVLVYAHNYTNLSCHDYDTLSQKHLKPACLPLKATQTPRKLVQKGKTRQERCWHRIAWYRIASHGIGVRRLTSVSFGVTQRKW